MLIQNPRKTLRPSRSSIVTLLLLARSTEISAHCRSQTCLGRSAGAPRCPDTTPAMAGRSEILCTDARMARCLLVVRVIELCCAEAADADLAVIGMKLFSRAHANTDDRTLPLAIASGPWPSGSSYVPAATVRSLV